MAVNFDTFDPAHLTGQFQVTVHDMDQNANQVLQSNLDFWINLDWTISGIAAPGLGGEWRIQVFAESMGPGYEGKIGEIHVPMANTPPATTRHFNQWLKITAPANQPAPGPMGDGVYKLVVVLRHFNQGVGQMTAAFAEGPVIEVYTP